MSVIKNRKFYFIFIVLLISCCVSEKKNADKLDVTYKKERFDSLISKKKALSFSLNFKDFGVLTKDYYSIDWGKVDYDSLMDINIISSIKGFEKRIKIKRAIYVGETFYVFELKKESNKNISLQISEFTGSGYTLKDSLIYSKKKNIYELNKIYFLNMKGKNYRICSGNIIIKDGTLYLDSNMEGSHNPKDCIEKKY